MVGTTTIYNKFRKLTSENTSELIMHQLDMFNTS